MKEKSPKKRFAHLPGGEIVFVTDSEKVKLTENTEDDFDLFALSEEIFHIFAVHNDGSLMHLCYNNGQIDTSVILKSKSSQSRVCKIRVLGVNNHIHIFYCIRRSENILVHQVFHDGILSQPDVVDRLNERMIYSVCADDCYNIHIVYVNTNGSTVYSRYNNSSKTHTPPTAVIHSDVRLISTVFCNSGIYASFVVAETNGASVYVCDVMKGICNCAVKRVSMRSRTFLVPQNDGFTLKWTENSMCFGIKCTPNMEFSRVSVMGKCGDEVRVRIPGETMVTDTTLCTASGNIEDFEKMYIRQNVPEHYVQKGYEIEEFSARYKEDFTKKSSEDKTWENESKLDEIIAKIDTLSEKISVLCTKKANGEYNTENKEEQK